MVHYWNFLYEDSFILWKRKTSMVACWSNGLSAWHTKVRIVIIKMSTWSQECPHPREKQKHSKNLFNQLSWSHDEWWRNIFKYNWRCDYNNCSLLRHCSWTTHLLMRLCEPNAHPLETHYDSFVDEPQTELPKVPHW